MYMHIVYPGFHGKLRQCDARLNEFEWLDELRELKGVWYLVENIRKMTRVTAQWRKGQSLVP